MNTFPCIIIRQGREGSLNIDSVEVLKLRSFHFEPRPNPSCLTLELVLAKEDGNVDSLFKRETCILLYKNL